MTEAPTTPGAARQRSDLALAAATFLLVFSVYFVGYSRTLPPTADEMIDFSLAESIAKWQVFSVDQVSTVGPNPEEFGLGGHRYSKYGPLQAALSVPLYLLAEELPIGAVDTVLLLNSLLTALIVALAFLLARRLGYGPGVALAVAAVVAFGTPLWVHAKRYLAEPTITVCLIATVYAAYVAATTRRPGWHVATGLLFGAAIAAKYIDGLLLAPVPAYLAITAILARPGAHSIQGRSRVRDLLAGIVPLIWFAVGLAPVLAALGWYDLDRFGSPLTSGYAHWEQFTTPVWEGVAGFLVSPGKSLFVYTPLFLLLPFWAPSFVRRFRAFGALLGAIVLLHLGVYGAWWVWWGAWSWGPRFIVPILPLLAIALAEGLGGRKGALTFALSRSTEEGLGVRAFPPSPIPRPPSSVVAGLGVLSVAIQLLGVAVDHTVYIVQLLPLNSKPDTLTIWDVRYWPVIHQIPLLTRQWLDFAWIERSGLSLVNWATLGPSLAGVGAAAVGFLIVWRAPDAKRAVPALAIVALILAGGVYRSLRVYEAQVDPTIAGIVDALAAAPADTAVVQLIPSSVVTFANWQKRPLPELGWIEEPRPSPTIARRLDQFAQRYAQLWVVTEAPPKAPSNGIEASLDRALVQIGDDPIGRFRLLRYATRSATRPVVAVARQFGDGVELAGFSVDSGSVAPGNTVDLVLQWKADDAARSRPDYTIFVHLVDAQGKLVAQHDDPPASGYLPTSGWTRGQIVFDDHALAIPNDAPAGLHLVQVGLYLPSTGQRVPLLGSDGKTAGDAVTLDLSEAGARASAPSGRGSG